MFVDWETYLLCRIVRDQMRQYFWANLWILKLPVVVVINAVRVNVSQSDFTALEIQTVAGTYSEHWKWKLLSCVRFFATQWPIQSMEFSRPEYWRG